MQQKNGIYFSLTLYNNLVFFKCCITRFCVGDQFYLLDNKILCGADYEERMLFANLPNHPDRLAQLKSQTSRLLQHPPGPSSGCYPPTSATSSHSVPTHPHPNSYPPAGHSYPPCSPSQGSKCSSNPNIHPLPPISSVKSLAQKRTALAM